MSIQRTLPIVMLSIIWCELISGQLTAPPPESKCNTAMSGWNRAGCSRNTDCVCHEIGKKNESASGGMCAYTMIPCSVLTPCESDGVTCQKSETICVHDHRCSNQPVCYPIALANLAVCPPMLPTNLVCRR